MVDDITCIDKVKLDIPVVFSVDRNYFPYFINACYSLLKFNKVTCIYLLTDFTLNTSQRRKILDKIKRPFGVKVKIVDLSNWLEDKVFFTSSHVSIATYFRLFIPEVLPCHENRVLFLDPDILVLGGLQELVLPIKSDMLCIAVQHGFEKDDLDHLSDERVDPAHYFNAGVLGLHLDNIRREGVFRLALEYVEKGKQFRYWDQDILNIVFNKRVHFISERFNFFDMSIHQEPKIVHFIGTMKPWHMMSRHPMRFAYIKFVIKNKLELPIIEFLMIRKIYKKIKSFFFYSVLKQG